MERLGPLLFYLLCTPALPSHPINPFKGKSFESSLEPDSIWGALALCPFLKLISSFFFLCYELHLPPSSSSPPLPHGEGGGGSPWRAEPSSQPSPHTKICSARTQRLPMAWQTPSGPVDDRDFVTVCPSCVCCSFYTMLVVLVWGWRGGKERDLSFLDRKPVLSSALLILLAQPEFSSCGVWGTSCWIVSLLMSPSKSGFFFIVRKSNSNFQFK